MIAQGKMLEIVTQKLIMQFVINGEHFDYLTFPFHYETIRYINQIKVYHLNAISNGLKKNLFS